MPRDRVTALTAGQSLTVGDVKVTAVPARHEAGIPGWEAPDAMGVVLEAEGLRIYHSGDTEYDVRLRGLKREGFDVVIACILGFTRQFPFILSRARDHRWLTIAEVPVQRRLRGRTLGILGILGFGRSGQRTAEKARAFGLDALAWTRTPRPADLARAGARAATFEEALECAFVSLHLPLTEATHGLIGREALARMRPDAVLVNIARGAIVDTDALVDALRAGRLAGAALDVVQPAPLPPEHPLWSIPNVWITSHTGGISVEAADDAWSTGVEDVIRVRNGLPPAHAVPELRGEVITTIEPGVLPPPGV